MSDNETASECLRCFERPPLAGEIVCAVCLDRARSLTVEGVRAVLAEIRALTARGRGDPEAHVKQDGLMTDVLLASAKGSPVAVDLAREALGVLAIDFSRWYQ